MRLTHGKICRTIEFLTYLRQERVTSLFEYSQIVRCTQEELLWVAHFCEICRLTYLAKGGKETITESGLNVADAYLMTRNCSKPFRMLLESYIENVKPGWANRMPVGRYETFSALSNDEYFCFREANLTDDQINEDLVTWWDRMAAFFRSEGESYLVKIGRKGEKLTSEYEWHRTGKRPKWESVESNFAGYDFLSCENSHDSTPRLIEVKSTEKPIVCSSFFVSRNEWETAYNSIGRYWFYLWQLSSPIQLAKVPASEIAQHISRDVGRGSWCSVEIPFLTFSHFFFPYLPI